MIVKQQTKTPVERYYYSEDEWNRLGPERDRAQQLQNVAARGNPATDGKNINGYN